MAIAKKITLLYSGIFSVSLIILSMFMIYHVASMRQQDSRIDLFHIINNIQFSIEQTGGLTEKFISALSQDTSIEVSIYYEDRNIFYQNPLGNILQTLTEEYHINPNFLDASASVKFQLHEDIFAQENLNLRLIQTGLNESHEYIFEMESGLQYMLLSHGVFIHDKYYQIDCLKLIDVNTEFLKSFILNLIILDCVGIFCAFLIGRYISFLMLRPIHILQKATKKISIDDLTQRISIEGPDDEMRELALTFNSMIDRLESSFEQQHQFISDASHELRTPIAVIQGYANLIKRWGKSDPDILEESLDSILVETEHMSSLIRKLLLLAKGDQNRMLVQKSIIDLSDVATEIKKDLEVLDIKQTIHLYSVPSIQILADPDLLKQLLWIYAENAIKYTKEHDTITIRIWKDKQYAYVSVEDTGTGIAKEDIPKIFDRFYRTDKSRNKEISGTGLGLSIAKWILDTHEGLVDVKSDLGKGTTFINRFPLHKEDTPKKIDLKKSTS